MRLINVLLCLALLTGCSVARKAAGIVSGIGSKTESITNAEAYQANSEAGMASRGISRADDLGAMSKKLPGGLVGDTKNSLHSGDPVTPQ